MNSDAPSYHGYRSSADIIAHAVWLYFRFNVSFRDVEDLLAQRGITVTYETIRQWYRTFGRPTLECSRSIAHSTLVTVRGASPAPGPT